MIWWELGRRHRERVGEGQVGAEEVLHPGEQHEHCRSALRLDINPFLVPWLVLRFIVDDVHDVPLGIEVDLAAVLALALDDLSIRAPVVVGDEFCALGICVFLSR